MVDLYPAFQFTYILVTLVPYGYPNKRYSASNWTSWPICIPGQDDVVWLAVSWQSSEDGKPDGGRIDLRHGCLQTVALEPAWNGFFILMPSYLSGEK